MKKLGLALVVLACGVGGCNLFRPQDWGPGDAATESPPPGGQPAATAGRQNHAQFLLDDQPFTPLAAGGASASLTVTVTLTAPSPGAATPQVTSIDTSDHSIATLSDVYLGAPSDPEAGATVTTAATGTTDIILYDAQAQEIDRATLTVVNVDALQWDSGTTTGSALVLVGTAEGIHVTSLSGGQVINSGGVVTFTVPSPMATRLDPISSAAGLLGLWGDNVAFTVDQPGTGTIFANTPSTTSSFTITAIDSSAVDAITFDPPRLTLDPGAPPLLTVRVTSGGQPVLGALCSWTVSSDVIVTPYKIPLLGAPGDAGISYQFESFPTSRPSTATCTLPGGRSASVTLNPYPN